MLALQRHPLYTMHLTVLVCVFMLPITRAAIWNLRVLHVNDMHSNYDPVDEQETPCREDDENFDQCNGGISRIVTKVKELSNFTDTIFLNGGDSTQGSLYFYLFGYPFIGRILSRMGFDAVVLGNHEFDDGTNGIASIIGTLNKNIPLLACNVDFHGDPRLDRVKPSTVLTVGTHKVGIIGYVTTETFSNLPPEFNVTFTEESICVSREAKKLKAQGVNVILGLGHSGYAIDQKLCLDVPELTAVVGAHDHYLLATSEIDEDETHGPYPTVVTRSDGSKCPVVQAYYISKYLGQLDLTIDDVTGKALNWTGAPILMTSDIQADATMESFLQPYRRRVDREGTKAIGETTVFLDYFDSTCSKHECNFGDLATDAMVAWFVNKYVQETPNITGARAWGEVSAAFLVSRPLKIGFRGPMTVYNLASQFFFNYKLMLLNMTGAELLNVLENSLDGYGGQHYNTFLQLSGIQTVYDVSNPNEPEVLEANIYCRECPTPIYKPIKATEYYQVATTVYDVEHASNLKFSAILNERRYIRTNVTMLDATQIWIKKLTPVFQGVENRITILS